LLPGIASEAQQSMFHADGWIASQCRGNPAGTFALRRERRCATIEGPATSRYPPFFQQQRKVLFAKHCDFQEQILSNGAMGDSYKLSK